MMSSSVDTGLHKGDTERITMECLPSDVVLDIFSRLPVESVLDCKLVHRKLLDLLRRRWNQFTKMHHRHQLLQLATYGDACSSLTGLLFSFQESEQDKTIGARLYYGDKYNDELNIHENFSYKTLQKTSISYPRMIDWDVMVGSYNGLICLIKYHHGIPDPIHICNPTTGEYVNLPEYTIGEDDYRAAFGFGYVHTNDQYKVVRIYYRGSVEHNHGVVEVYTIGGGSGWRNVGRTTYQLFTPTPRGTFVNGSLHWIDDEKIVAFNLADEKFVLIQSPPCCNGSFDDCFYRLQALRGNLCLCHQRNEERLLDIWSLKKNATETSWSRDFSITYDSAWETDIEFPVRLLLITKKNEVLFVHQGETLYCYDPKTTTVIKLWGDGKSGIMRLTAVPHMNSFVSLKALGERSESKKKVIDRSTD